MRYAVYPDARPCTHGIVALATLALGAVSSFPAQADQKDGSPVAFGLSGQLSNAQTDAAVACGVVELTPAEGGEPFLAPTDATGMYFFEPLPAGAYAVRVVAPGFFDRIAPPIDIVLDAPRTEDFALTPRLFGGALRGVVRDAATGLALPMSRIELLMGGVVLADALSCAEGRYSISLVDIGLPVIGSTEITVRFTAREYLPETRALTLTGATGAILDQELVTFAGSGGIPAALVGLVQQRVPDALEGLPGTRILIQGVLNLALETGDDGTYSVDTLPAGRYTVSASAPGFRSQVVQQTLSESEVRELSFVLESDEPTSTVFGDVNGDGVVNALDVQLVINAALGLEIPPGVAADINDDGTVNAVDVQLVINAALGIVES